ncbi:peptidoglycan-binding domain-containing protein [Streptomyces sp. 3214.6]|uniref:peptidoglycan-binding domain-containing protein n=1 Tax=Streptomyces sp. 3214.6 TaxID=1882757 RepID=UPI00090B04F9|nr:peptidoglycan-binding domain-containing protein [Streptomyces sp. 3214.6]SHI25828.1 Putative peptidoglycan binding domain-containing protein [Streptomyces sp. 3214.6]
MIDPTGRQGPSGQRGLPCPQCGALRAPDNTPSCSCAQRAAESLRDTRTAEAAAAEDFDPLRIRPYVELEGQQPPTEGGGGTPAEGGSGTAGGAAWAAVSPDGELTMPLPAVPADATMRLRAVDPAGPPPHTTAAPFAPPAALAAEPGAGDLSLFEAAAAGAAHPDDEEPRSPHRRRTLLVATAAAVVAVVAAAGFASGLFSYDKPTRDGAAPKDVRAAVPVPSTSASSGTPSASPSAPPSASEASVSPSERGTPSPSAAKESASPSASPSSAATAASQATPTAHVSVSARPGNGADKSAPISEGTVLRRGDTGAEVTELQLRLRQVFFYNGDADGTFGSEVEEALRNYQWSRGTTADGLGVYGVATRTKLESETTEP